ncbi:hypothetical protein [Paenibacillus illinoisensis]|uniref:Abortive phage resistance protein n=1 Tax=Paenibacillus illinoisensis TaxID=59845 RepID=A0A2W0CC59_9BACL|nr:hypothetical protein [Paenibacillus illinoisensis]PYY29757.1 Abortive phage resistance protein [Paenibacillus illinoisensis]
MINDRIQEVERLKRLVTDAATSSGSGSDEEYKQLRNKIIKSQVLKELLPIFLKDSRSLMETLIILKLQYQDMLKEESILKIRSVVF